MSNLDDTGLDLNQLFLPAWAQQSPDSNKYANFDGYSEDDKSGDRGSDRRRGPRRPRSEFSPRGGAERGERRNRPPRSGNRDEAGRRERSQQSPDGDGKAGGSERRGGDNRGQGGRRRESGNRRDNRGDRRNKPELPPLPELDVQLVPENIVVETLARQIRQSGRAYPLFEIANIILKKPERLGVTYSTIKKGDQVAQALYICTLDRTLWLSEDDAMEHVFKEHFANFYETQKVPVEGPKGTYTFVAQCGMSGEVLGPPNLHDYQSKICKIHDEKFPNVPLEVYKSRIRIVKDPEIIEKWKQEMSFASHYNCLQVPEPLVLQDMASVREHFRQTHLASVVQKVDTFTLSHDEITKQPNRLIVVLYRRLLDDQRRFPLKLVTTLSLKFAAHALQFFKIDKNITHVCVSRPHYLDLESTTVSENVRNIMGYVTANPGCKRADIYGALIPGYAEAISKIPEPTAPAKKKSPAKTSPAPAEADAVAPAEATAPAEPTQAPVAETTATESEPEGPSLPPEVASGLASLNADLHWLIQCGHVIEFYKGNIEPAPKKATPPPAKPKQKKAENKAEKAAKKPAVEAANAEEAPKAEEAPAPVAEETPAPAPAEPETAPAKAEVAPVAETQPDADVPPLD